MQSSGTTSGGPSIDQSVLWYYITSRTWGREKKRFNKQKVSFRLFFLLLFDGEGVTSDSRERERERVRTTSFSMCFGKKRGLFCTLVVRSHRLLSSSVAVVVVVVIFLNLNYRMSLVLRLLSRRRSREKDHHHFLSRAQSVTFQNKETHPKEEEEEEDKTKPLSLFKVSNASPQTLNRL